MLRSMSFPTHSSDLLALLTVVGYALLFAVALRSTRSAVRLAGAGPAGAAPETRASHPSTMGVAVSIWIVAALHAATLALQTFDDAGLVFGFAAAASATLWIAALVYSLESLVEPIRSVPLLLFPAAAVACAASVAFPGRVVANAGGPLFALHFLLALASYGVLLVAAVQALLSLAADRALHDLGRRGERAGLLTAYLPPLLSMERLLFRLIYLGFALLTLTLFSGIAFHERIFGTTLRFDHKTVFALVSWIIFAGLIVGRWRYGWRGRLALKYVLAGFVALLLSYIGTQFVLEVVLRR